MCVRVLHAFRPQHPPSASISRSTATRRTAPATGRRDLDTGGRDDGEGGAHEHDPEAEERRERALIQWEEGKKLNGKIDALKYVAGQKVAGWGVCAECVWAPEGLQLGRILTGTCGR